MKRYWVWVAGVLIAIGAIVVVTGEEHYTRNKYEAKRQEDCVALAVSLEEKHSCAKEAQSRHEYVPWGHKLLAWPDGITTWAIIATGFVIAWQSYETRRSAEAARDSIRIQEAGMRQWVNVVPNGLDIRDKFKDPTTTVLKFEVVNKTDFPLTILQIDIEIAATINKSETFVEGSGHFLVPQKADADSAYPFFVEVLTVMKGWDDRGKVFIVAGEIKFLDCVGMERTQIVEDLYRGFRSGELERMKPIGITAPPQAD